MFFQEPPRRKSQNLNFSDGYPQVRDPESHRKHRVELVDSLKDYTHADTSHAGSDENHHQNFDALPAPKWLKYDRQVLICITNK
mgnify:CR=1 FL=1